MRNLWNFALRKPQSFWEYCLWIIATVMIIFIWENIWLYFLFWHGIDFNSPNFGMNKIKGAEFFISALITAPLIEEFLFRFLPIMITKAITSNFAKWPKFLIMFGMIVGSSVLFAFVHFDWPKCLLFQGVGGLLLSLLFLKCMNYKKSAENIFKFNRAVLCAFAAVVSAHALHNLLVLL